MRSALYAFLLLAVAGTAGAQAVYRCGSVYSHAPCAGAVTVSQAPERSAADAARASSQAQRDGKLAAEMEKTRLQQEARAPKAVIPPESKAQEPAPDRVEGKKLAKAEKHKHFTAVGPKPVSTAAVKKKGKKKD